MPKTSASHPGPRVSKVQVALERLAEAQEATQAELHDLVTHVRHLSVAQRRTGEQVRELAAAQRWTEEHLAQLVQHARWHDHELDRLVGRQLERRYR